MTGAPVSSAQGDSPPASLWFRFTAAMFSASAMVIGLFTAAGFGARYWWRCEQLCHFRAQYFWLLALGTIVYLICRRRTRAAVLGLLAIVNLATIVPIYLPESWIYPAAEAPSIAERFPLRVMTFNVRASNRHHDDVLAYMRDQQPDVALILEVSAEWSSALESLRPEYPYQHHVPRADNFGISILSRQPWKSVQTVFIGDASVPSIVARFQRDGEWTMIGTHPVPPGSAWTSQARNVQLAAIAEFVRRETPPVVLAGDLNVTSWSPFFDDLLHDGNLRDSRQGRGVQPTWVSRIPLTDLPIDHILTSPNVVVEKRFTGPHLGSDHRPVVADLLIPKQ